MILAPEDFKTLKGLYFAKLSLHFDAKMQKMAHLHEREESFHLFKAPTHIFAIFSPKIEELGYDLLSHSPLSQSLFQRHFFVSYFERVTPWAEICVEWGIHRVDRGPFWRQSENENCKFES